MLSLIFGLEMDKNDNKKGFSLLTIFDFQPQALNYAFLKKKDLDHCQVF